jgi:circadian clock protein KaiC
MNTKTAPGDLSTGIAGLDDILQGGVTANCMYVVEGVPGSGKTTLSLQFLLAGARRGEPVLYVNLSESTEEILAVAASHGWSFDGVTIRELALADQLLVAPEKQYTIFHPSEIELTETTKTIMAAAGITTT